MTDRPRISDEELRQWTNRADDAGRLARELSALRTALRLPNLPSRRSELAALQPPSLRRWTLNP